MTYPDDLINVDHEFGNSGTYGLTKREYFAIHALQGLLSDPNRNGSSTAFCISAVECADKLIIELNK